MLGGHRRRHRRTKTDHFLGLPPQHPSIVAEADDGEWLEKSRVHVEPRRKSVHIPSSCEREEQLCAQAQGRKSMPHLEMNVRDVAAALGVKVMSADMPPFMQAHALRCARRAHGSILAGGGKFSSRQMAHDMKKEFDKVYGAPWQCVVGSSFGSFVTHASGCFLYFAMPDASKLTVMLFKTKIRLIHN